MEKSSFFITLSLLMDSDETLWTGIMQGDKEMYLTLYRRYYNVLLFIGLKEVKDAHFVKDAIQQQFLYLWEKREKIQAAENVRSYLITSFLRRLTAELKRSGKSGNLDAAWNYQSKDPQPSPEENLIKKDEQNHLSKLIMNHINTLPARQKELIILKFYEGLTYEEIVQKTGLTHRTVYNKIHEALKNLKLNIDKNERRYSYHTALSVILYSFLAFSPVIPGHH